MVAADGIAGRQDTYQYMLLGCSMDLWKAISYVSSPLTLVAFLAAVVAWIYITQLGRITRLITNAKESDRRVLIEGIFDVMRVDPHKLPAAKRYELAQQLIHGRSLKLKLAFVAFLIVAFGLLALSAFAIYSQPASTSVEELLTGDRRTEALSALKQYKIYEVNDAGLPDALTSVVALDDKQKTLGAAEKSEILKAKIAGSPSISELRKRADKGLAPFERLGVKQIVGVPKIGPDQPPRFYVNVPIQSEWAWKRLRIYNPKTDTELRLIAKPAIDDYVRDVDLHLNHQQAKHLFNASLPKRTATVWIEVLSEGKLYDPSCEASSGPQSTRPAAQCNPEEYPEMSTVLGARS